MTTITALIDYGCDFGILAPAAIKLGAREVWAVDNDPQPLEATQENAQHNQVNLHTVLSEQLPHLQADHLVANILPYTNKKLNIIILSIFTLL